jgi:phospholipase/carboxylesterase
VAESIDAAVDRYDLDPDRLGLTGFSQGAVMTCSLLLEAPGRYAWIAALHGYLAAVHADLDLGGLDGTPAFVAAGTADQLIPASRAEAAADRLRELGGAVTFGTYPTGHGVGPDELRDLVGFFEAHAT